MSQPLVLPRPEKTDDLGGARVAAVAEFRRLNPFVHPDRIRVEYRGVEIVVYEETS